MKKKLGFFGILLITALMVYIAAFGIKTEKIKLYGAPDIRFGIDIRGGVEAIFQPVGIDTKPTSEQLEAARAVFETRLDQRNIVDREVIPSTTEGYIIVRFPWKADETEFDPAKAIDELGQTAKLTFQDAQGNVLLDGQHVVNAKPARDENNLPVVNLVFDEEGTKIFSNITKKLIGQPLSIYMDEENICTATVMTQITNGEAIITNMKSFDRAKKLANQINSGALPFSMEAKTYSTISPSLGTGSLKVMVNAGLIAYILICILLIVYYRLPGFVASIALLIQIAGQILFLSIPQMSLTLSGIAGIILSIGMGVDANVISSERINEEIKAGKSVEAAIGAGFSNSFASIFDGNVTVLIVSVILMLCGSGSLASFGYTLFAGIVFNFIAGVTASRIMIYSLSSYKFLKKPALYTCLTRRVTL